MVFIQQNVCKENKDPTLLIASIINRKADVIFLEEYSESKHQGSIKKRLIEIGYEIYYPLEYNWQEDSNCIICLLAVKNNIKFKKHIRSAMSLSLRYIAGILTNYEGNKVEFLGVYIPQCVSNKDVEYCQDRIEYKAEMLFDTYQFMLENNEKNAIVMGDFNTDFNKNKTRLSSMFKTIYETFSDVTRHECTWSDRCLDYILVSKSLTPISRYEILETNSDHKGILAEIEIANERENL